MENKILALTGVQNGVCVNDPFLSLVQDLSNSIGITVDYFTFDKDPINSELSEMVAKDTLDRLSESIFDHTFVVIDSRLNKELLDFVIGFVLCSGGQIGSFFIDDIELQSYLEEKIKLRKDHDGSEELLIIGPESSQEEGVVSISEAIDKMIMCTYDRIKFLDGVYDSRLVNRVLSFCYGSGTIVIDWTFPENAYIKVIVSKW